MDVRGSGRAVRRLADSMIEFCKAYKVGDKTFASLAEAQHYEINLICHDKLKVDDEATNQLIDSIAANIICNANKVIDILSTTVNSRPKARKANGGTKKRKAGVDVSKLTT